MGFGRRLQALSCGLIDSAAGSRDATPVARSTRGVVPRAPSGLILAEPALRKEPYGIGRNPHQNIHSHERRRDQSPKTEPRFFADAISGSTFAGTAEEKDNENFWLI